ncbi:hypothetical protein [Profundibacter sp.]
MTEATTLKRPHPPEPIRLMMTAFMAFIKGAVISAIVIAPFLGIWAAVGTSLAFTAFCVWLAHKKGAGGGVGQSGCPRKTDNRKR